MQIDPSTTVNNVKNASKTADEASVRSVLADLHRAIKNKDIDGILSCYTSDVIYFDVRDSLRLKNLNELRDSWVECFESATEFNYDLSHMDLYLSGDIALCTSFGHVTGTATDGSKIDQWLRSTIAFRCTQDQWSIFHQHDSAPGDYYTGKVLNVGPGDKVRHD